jgi:hypothetical protein
MRARAVIGGWVARNTRAVALVAVGALGGGAAFAVASVPDGSGAIHTVFVRGTGGGGAPTNRRVAFTQTPSGKPQGRVVAGWDQTKNTPFTPTTLLPAP